jgi:predicted GNAT family N-acyltransferase
MKLIAKKPSDCSAREIKSFCDLLTEGGEVQEAGRSELIKKATSLVFLRDDEATIGIAGLKCPRPAYKKRVFVGAKTNQNSNHFSYELGWIYIEPKYRGLGHSHPLVEKALAEVGSNNVFATSRSG